MPIFMQLCATKCLNMQKPTRMNLSRFCFFSSAFLLTLCAVAARYAGAYAQERDRLAEPPFFGVLGHQAWSSENGLPQNSVHQILQTRDGYLWIATEGGVARFNGMQFTVFNQENDSAITSNDACCLAEDRTGVLWIGTSDGLLRYAGGAFRRYTTADGLPSPVVSSLAPTDDGFLLVLTGDGLAKYDGRRFTPLKVSASALGSGPNDRVWLATATALFTYNLADLRAIPVPDLPKEPIEGLGSLQDGSKWVRTHTAFLLWNQGHLRIWRSGYELPGTRVLSFLADSRGILWVGTDQGLVALSTAPKSENARLEIQPAIGAAPILTMFEDREHNLWVGTDTTGLHILRQQKFRTLPALSGYPITAITQSANGTLWMGSKGEGLFRYAGNQTRRLSTKDGLISDVILTVAADRDGSLWIGTPDGLNHLQGEKIESYTSADGLPDDFIRSLYADRDGSLWIGTRRGLAHRQNGHFTVLSRADGLPSDLIGAMLRSSSNDLWIGTLDGLARIRDGKVNIFSKAQGLSGNVITSLLEDANEHTIWVGTKDSGLSRSSANGFTPIHAREIPREIDTILEDARGYLWLTSSHGIIRVLASELMACGEAAECSPHIATYSSSDGLPTDEMSSSGHPGGWRAVDGRLWFATRKGVAVVDPASLHENRTPPSVIVERFTIDDIGFKNTGKEITIPPGHIKYGFEYAGLSYVSPSKVRYRYILEGFDKQWTQAGSRRNAYYTNLPPRHYRFRVQAANEDGIWNQTGAEVAFVIEPRFYRTLWFSGLATLLLAGFIFAMYRLRVRAIRSQFDAILAERNRIAREIHDTLAQGFVGVSVQLELTAHLLAHSRVDEASQQVDRTRNIVREGLADARRSIWDLRAVGTQATLPIRLTHLVEQSGTGPLKTDIDIGGIYRALSPALENEVVRIAQEALANAVRHSGASRIAVHLRYHPNELTLTVRDYGMGFHATDTTLPAKGHFGLQGMRERADQIGGTLRVESSPEGGTTVTLAVPLSNGKE
ncbi:MAG: putative two-component system sensor kinase [Bryobacterales bacterium]|nr:putative two-component system sensor kinase [Bryobacterales bacterium]